MSRILKLLLPLCMFIAVFGALLNPTFGQTDASSVTPPLTPERSPLKPLGRGPAIASIVYLELGNYGGQLPPETVSDLKEEHASEVYLYVAAHSDAFFAIDDKAHTLGMVSPVDSLKTAVATLHAAGYHVVVVISSALLDPRQATPAQRKILQPNGDIFEPKQAKPLLTDMVTSLTKYPVDGIYVGEPYFTKQTRASGLTNQKRNEWLDLYQSLMAITKKAKIPFDMILPDNYIVGLDAEKQSGLPAIFASLQFNEIGMDLENAYSRNPQADLKQFELDVQNIKKLAGNRMSLIEIGLRYGGLKDYDTIPPSFFNQEVNTLIQNHISRLVLFADEFWSDSPYQKQYQAALVRYLNSSSTK